ncbi:lytic transglycosylase domain-containing protein, partial [Bifidobacterium vansinderenii]
AASAGASAAAAAGGQVVPDGQMVDRKPGKRRVSRAVGATVHRAWSASADRSDAASSMGVDSVGLSVSVASKPVGAVGRAAGRKAKRAAGAKIRSWIGVEQKVEETASRRIVMMKKAGRASNRIGRAFGGGVHDVRSRLTAEDTDVTSRIGSSAQTLAFRSVTTAGRGAVKGTAFAVKHRHAPAQAARATVSGARGFASAVSRAASAARVAVTRAIAAVSAGSAPMALVVAAVTAVAVVLVAILSWLPLSKDQSAAVAGGDVQNVPAEYVEDVKRAGSICATVTPAVIAAQIEAESNWNPNAGSSAGAQGIAQFIPSTWATHGMDGDGDGRADVMNPHDAIWSQGNYMCQLADGVAALQSAGRVSGDALSLTLAAYNAGLGAVANYHGIPPYKETQGYVQKIVGRVPYYQAAGEGSDGAQAGTLSPPMIMKQDGYHVDFTAMGIAATSTTYELYQCTWWASVRRAQIGKPVDPYMGNGGQWNEKGLALGYSVSGAPRPGDVIVFEPGVHGSSRVYGHVAVVEQVNGDGSILISQSGTGWMAVVTETISAQSLSQMGSGISFIH